MEWWGFSKKERGAIILILFIIVTSLSLKYSGILSAGRTTLDDRKIVEAIAHLRSLDSLDSLGEKESVPNKLDSRRSNTYETQEKRSNQYFEKARTDSSTRLTTSKRKNTSFQYKSWRKDKENLIPKYSEGANEKVNVNTADTTLLKTIRGIGSYFSKKIVSYRTSLGGYHHLDQLLEIYKMDSSRLAKVSPFLFVDTSMTLKTISINTANIEELGYHPYITFKQAKAIVKYRKQHGDFLSIQDLLNIVTLDQSWLSNVQMYISLQ